MTLTSAANRRVGDAQAAKCAVGRGDDRLDIESSESRERHGKVRPGLAQDFSMSTGRATHSTGSSSERNTPNRQPYEGGPPGVRRSDISDVPEVRANSTNLFGIFGFRRETSQLRRWSTSSGVRGVGRGGGGGTVIDDRSSSDRGLDGRGNNQRFHIRSGCRRRPLIGSGCHRRCRRGAGTGAGTGAGAHHPRRTRRGVRSPATGDCAGQDHPAEHPAGGISQPNKGFQSVTLPSRSVVQINQ